MIPSAPLTVRLWKPSFIRLFSPSSLLAVSSHNDHGDMQLRSQTILNNVPCTNKACLIDIMRQVVLTTLQYVCLTISAQLRLDKRPNVPWAIWVNLADQISISTYIEYIMISKLNMLIDRPQHFRFVDAKSGNYFVLLWMCQHSWFPSSVLTQINTKLGVFRTHSVIFHLSNTKQTVIDYFQQDASFWIT